MGVGRGGAGEGGGEDGKELLFTSRIWGINLTSSGGRAHASKQNHILWPDQWFS